MEINYQTRAAQAGDLEAVYSLICEMQEKALDKSAFENIFIDYLLRGDVRLRVAEYQEKVVGVIGIHFYNHLHHAGRIAEVSELAVASAFRNKGIGKRLLTEAEIEACKEGCLVFELSTHMRRKDAHRFYLREGMECSHYKFTKTL